MHDLDRTTQESEFYELQPETFEYQETPEFQEWGESEYSSGESGAYETGYETGLQEMGYGESEYQEAVPYELEWQETTQSEVGLNEADEMELAGEFLEITNEQELDQFLGGLFKKIGRGIGKVIRSPIGKAIGGVLKPLAKAALPLAGRALGGFVGGPLGAMVGGKLAGMAGKAFGLELEGMSAEDREFEVARRFVRFAGAATRNAALAPPRQSPIAAARRAVYTASKKYAPGIINVARSVVPRAQGAAQGAPSYGVPSTGGLRRGIWVRRGRRIILLGV